MLTFNSMMNEHLRKFGHVKAMERSIHSARLSFVETLHREGKMSDPEYAILDDWYRFLTNQELPKHPSGFDTDADLIGTSTFNISKQCSTLFNVQVSALRHTYIR